MSGRSIICKDWLGSFLLRETEPDITVRLPIAFDSTSAELLLGAKPPKMYLKDYVLSRFSKGEQEQIDQAFTEAAKAVAVMITEGPERAMNQFNTRKKDLNEE